MSGYERRGLRRLGPMLDKINIALSILIVISGIFLAVDRKKYAIMFGILFMSAAILNGVLAFKCYKMAEMGRMILLAIAAVFLLILGIIALIVTI